MTNSNPEFLLSCSLLPAIALALASSGCTTEIQTEGPERGPIAQQLSDMGFSSVPDAPAQPDLVPEGEAATVYAHEDSRMALLISDDLGADKYGLVFDATGELQSRLSPDSSEATYCYACDIGYWSCYGSCTLPCWYDWGFGAGCNADCSRACDDWLTYACQPVFC